MQYLQCTRELTLTIESGTNTQWWVDSSYAVHPDMCSHSGIMMTLGKGATYSTSCKQKLNMNTGNETVWKDASHISNTALERNGDIVAGQIDGYLEADHGGYEDEETQLAMEGESTGPELKSMPLLYVALPEMPVNAEAEVELVYVSSKLASCMTLQSHESTDLVMIEQHTCVFDSSMRYIRGCCALLYITATPSSDFSIASLVHEMIKNIQKLALVSEIEILEGRMRLYYDVSLVMDVEMLRHSLREAPISLAHTLVAVNGIRGGAALAANVQVLDLVHMETELWIRHNRSY